MYEFTRVGTITGEVFPITVVSPIKPCAVPLKSPTENIPPEWSNKCAVNFVVTIFSILFPDGKPFATITGADLLTSALSPNWPEVPRPQANKWFFAVFAVIA